MNWKTIVAEILEILNQKDWNYCKLPSLYEQASKDELCTQV